MSGSNKVPALIYHLQYKNQDVASGQSTSCEDETLYYRPDNGSSKNLRWRCFAMNKWAKEMAELGIPNETGNRYGRLVVTELMYLNKEFEVWKCICDCGEEIKPWGKNLRAGLHTTCGCKLPPDRTRDPNYSYRSLPGGKSALNSVYKGYRNSAKRRGTPFEISKEYFLTLTSSPCHYCGSLPSNLTRTNSGNFYIYNGLDRVDNRKEVGYVPENVVPSCFQCNSSKRDLPYDEFISWIDRLIANRHNLEKDRSSPNG